MKLSYIGPHDAVEVVGAGVVKHGETFTVKAALGKALLEQPDNYVEPDRELDDQDDDVEPDVGTDTDDSEESSS